MKNRFKTAREHLGLTQYEVSDAIGLSRNSISKAEQIDKIEKPNVHYTNYLRKKGISQDWLLYEKGNMLDDENNISYEDIEEYKKELEQVKKEKSYLEKKIEKLEETVKQLMATVHLLSGKKSEHKKAAYPNEKKKNSFVLGLSYVPATN